MTKHLFAYCFWHLPVISLKTKILHKWMMWLNTIIITVLTYTTWGYKFVHKCVSFMFTSLRLPLHHPPHFFSKQSPMMDFFFFIYSKDHDFFLFCCVCSLLSFHISSSRKKEIRNISRFFFFCFLLYITFIILRTFFLL